MSRTPKPIAHMSDQHELQLAKSNIDKFILIEKSGEVFLFHFHDGRIIKVMKEDLSLPVGSIVLGRVEKIAPQIEGAFVRLTADKTISPQKQTGFLKSINSEHLIPMDMPVKVNQKGAIFEGTLLPVQVKSLPIKTKQISVSTEYELAGTFAVVTTQKHTEKDLPVFSHKLTAETAESLRDNFYQYKESLSEELKDLLQEDVKVLFRSACDSCLWDEIAAELNQMLEQLLSIKLYGMNKTAFSVLYQGKGELLSYMQSFSDHEQCEAVTDSQNVMNYLISGNCSIPVRLYKDSSLSLSQVYSLKTKCEELTGRKVYLKSGGFLVIDKTEALSVIDVNTGKADTSNLSCDDYAFAINKEAALECFYQISARNMSGMILIDFINMKDKEIQAKFISFLKEECHKDSIPLRFYDFTRLGLAEFTRKKSGAEAEAVLLSFYR